MVARTGLSPSSLPRDTRTDISRSQGRVTSRKRETRRSRAEGPPSHFGRTAPADAWNSPERVLALIGLLAVWFALFLPQLIAGKTFTLGDAASFRPFPEYSRERWVQTRERTYWNPYTFLGVDPVASLADSRPQYLPDVALELVSHLSQPRFAPQLWLLLLHLCGAYAIMFTGRLIWGARWVTTLAGGLTWLLSI